MLDRVVDVKLTKCFYYSNIFTDKSQETKLHEKEKKAVFVHTVLYNIHYYVLYCNNLHTVNTFINIYIYIHVNRTTWL